LVLQNNRSSGNWSSNNVNIVKTFWNVLMTNFTYISQKLKIWNTMKHFMQYKQDRSMWDGQSPWKKEIAKTQLRRTRKLSESCVWE
jgi:hypothetical protein